MLHLLTIWAVASALGAVESGAALEATFYVSTNGNDGWSGTLATPNAARDDGPFATLARARDAVRQRKTEGERPHQPVTVVVQSGTYLLDQPLEFTADDSGTRDAPIVYKSEPGESVRISAATRITGWQSVTAADVRAQLDEAARDQVQQADLESLGITDFGSPASGGIELFFNDRPMTLARWPNEGFVPVVNVMGKTRRVTRGIQGCEEGIFEYEGDRPLRWDSEQDVWVHGYWFWDWAEQRHPVKAIDTGRRTIEVHPPYHGYGYRKGQWFYAFNLLSEIDQPGEWYVDRERGILYFWPPSPVEKGEAIVSRLPSILSLKDVSHVSFQGFTFEGARGTAVTISGGVECQLIGCTFRNAGGWAARASGGQRHRVVDCHVYQMGAGGISLRGGDRASLTPAGHVAENNHIHDYARVKRVYQPAIDLHGVGNRAAHNLIHDAPHMGIGFRGNDHRIEFNEIHRVCLESNDAGAIYTGRDWTMRGTIIRHNYLHHINGFKGRGCMGVYLDDMYCGTEISGNIFYRVTRAAFIGGGRDCVVKHNLFVDCKPALHVDSRALGWAHGHSDKWIEEGRTQGTLSGIRYDQPPYSERYPELVRILDEQPAAPKGNRVFGNVSYGGKWDKISSEARKYLDIERNLVDVPPRFATPERIGEDRQPRPVDFALLPDSPAWEIGFQKLPLDKIGLYPNPRRAGESDQRR